MKYEYLFQGDIIYFNSPISLDHRFVYKKKIYVVSDIFHHANVEVILPTIHAIYEKDF